MKAGPALRTVAIFAADAAHTPADHLVLADSIASLAMTLLAAGADEDGSIRKLFEEATQTVDLAHRAEQQQLRFLALIQDGPAQNELGRDGA